uniref:Uncharacterized protein n=1 Tax=Glossina pallidipes TaxID=7398 RepID=A0A1A9ZI47_GLOPL
MDLDQHSPYPLPRRDLRLWCSNPTFLLAAALVSVFSFSHFADICFDFNTEAIGNIAVGNGVAIALALTPKLRSQWGHCSAGGGCGPRRVKERSEERTRCARFGVPRDGAAATVAGVTASVAVATAAGAGAVGTALRAAGLAVERVCSSVAFFRGNTGVTTDVVEVLGFSGKPKFFGKYEANSVPSRL